MHYFSFLLLCLMSAYGTDFPFYRWLLLVNLKTCLFLDLKVVELKHRVICHNFLFFKSKPTFLLLLNYSDILYGEHYAPTLYAFECDSPKGAIKRNGLRRICLFRPLRSCKNASIKGQTRKSVISPFSA